MKGHYNPQDLSPMEAVKYDSFQNMILQAYQNIYVQVREGAYETELAEGWWTQLAGVLDNPGAKQHWDRRKSFCPPIFEISSSPT